MVGHGGDCGVRGNLDQQTEKQEPLKELHKLTTNIRTFQKVLYDYFSCQPFVVHSWTCSTQLQLMRWHKMEE